VTTFLVSRTPGAVLIFLPFVGLAAVAVDANSGVKKDSASPSKRTNVRATRFRVDRLILVVVMVGWFEVVGGRKTFKQAAFDV
jgi:hypothetical protein